MPRNSSKLEAKRPLILNSNYLETNKRGDKGKIFPLPNYEFWILNCSAYIQHIARMFTTAAISIRR